MTPIKSNTKGSGIHSPFAFRMVSEILFSRKNYSSIENVLDKRFPKKEMAFMKSVCRIAWSPLGLKRVVFMGDLSKKLADAIFLYIGQIISCNEKLTFENEFVAWLSVPESIPAPPENFNNTVWILYKIGNSEMRNFFEELKKHKKVSQTFELKTHAVVVFNPLLQKEDYIIKGRQLW